MSGGKSGLLLPLFFGHLRVEGELFAVDEDRVRRVDEHGSVAGGTLHDGVVEGVFAGQGRLLAELQQADRADDVLAVHDHRVLDLFVAVAANVHAPVFYNFRLNHVGQTFSVPKNVE